MISYFLNKLFYALLTLFGVVTVIFLLFNVLPGDPAKMMLGQNQSAEQVETVRKKYGFDKPKLTQFGYYLNDLSPLSIHSSDTDSYTFLDHNKFSFVKIFALGETTVVLKYPYLRESFSKQGKKILLSKWSKRGH